MNRKKFTFDNLVEDKVEQDTKQFKCGKSGYLNGFDIKIVKVYVNQKR